ncbi:Dabb family protein [Algibacillus agarilyticus]|uniref:Dabb family protein n=1 Tax=Algibacillus agarilyticus TaxID=2234133 RepID=UPI000DCFEB98|nr:Dabb family protein [Algibacillus agarilyticus]
MIRHTVAFKLKHAAGSAEEDAFLAKAKELALIPGVEKFECLVQISTKNNFDFGLSMEFANQTAYQTYNEAPLHQAFVNDYWLVDVIDFLEIDYQL